jgi:hypothetical protein
MLYQQAASTRIFLVQEASREYQILFEIFFVFLNN